MAGAPLAIEITARLDKFRSEMAKIPDIGGKEAKALTAQLSKEIKGATKAAEDAARGAKAGKAGFDSLGDAAGKAGSNTMKLAGAASMVTPALGDMTRNAGDAFDVLEVLGTLPGPLAAGLGAVAVALGTGALAWKVYNADAEEAARISAEVRDAQAKLAPILDATRQASIDLDEATGKLNETQAKQARDQLAAWSQLQAATSETRKKIQGLQEDQQSFGTVAVDTLEAIVPAWTPFGHILRKTTTDSADLKVEMDALGGVITDGQGKTRALVEIQKEETETLKKNTAAAKENADARMSFEDQVFALRESQAAKEADRQAAIREANNGYLIEAAEVEAKVQEEITKKEADESAKRVEAAKKEADEKVTYQRMAEDSYIDAMGSTADALATISDRIGKKNKEAALAAFYVSQGVAATQVAIQTIVAASRAMSDLPYPANIAVAVAAGAAGAAQEAAILSTPAPTFSDTPGPVAMGNGVGRTTASFGAGDMVVASRTKEGLRAQVDPYATRTTGGNMTVINRRTFGATVRDDVRVNSPLARLSASSPTSLGFR